MKRIQVTAILCLSFQAGRLQAEGRGAESVLVHPFKANQHSDSAVDSLSLTRAKTLSFRSQTLEMRKKWGLNSRIQMLEKGFKGFNLYQNNKLQTVEVAFSVDGFPLCQFQVKFVESLQGQVAAMGTIPRIDDSPSFQANDWPAQEVAGQRIVETLLVKGLNPDFTIDHSSRCLWENEGVLQPVWELDVVSGDLLYNIVADGQDVYRFEPKHFHAVGTANIYPNNILDGAREKFSLRDMKDPGYLENPYFITCVPSGTGTSLCPPSSTTGLPYPMVKDAGFNYDYDPIADQNSFVQTSVFTNVNRALEWYEQQGYTNFGTVPIRLAVHAAFQGDTNNALYEPRSTYSVIYVGDGDGTLLQNLGTDSDVVSHELGHHVIYNTLKRIEGESLVIHEGIADFFTFARTGNACLGESICTDTNVGARICSMPRQCLRSAANDFAFGSKSLPSEPHQRSQFISGMLWDLSVKDGIPINDVTRLVLKTIDLFVIDSGYQHLIVGLLLADDAIFQGAHCQPIIDRAIARGLSAVVEGVSCKIVQDPARPRVNVQTFLDGKLPDPPTTSSKKSAKKSCGAIGSSAAGGQDLSQLLLWCLPFIVGLVRRSRK